uniref:Uncharacterized protein n=1 Tax=Mycena chlorophos TaxID=658473 RepID=A0ABQ0KWD5_MYCCL|nr:predicted protein [Mycena chlorophos]
MDPPPLEPSETVHSVPPTVNMYESSSSSLCLRVVLKQSSEQLRVDEEVQLANVEQPRGEEVHVLPTLSAIQRARRDRDERMKQIRQSMGYFGESEISLSSETSSARNTPSISTKSFGRMSISDGNISRASKSVSAESSGRMSIDGGNTSRGTTSERMGRSRRSETSKSLDDDIESSASRHRQRRQPPRPPTPPKKPRWGRHSTSSRTQSPPRSRSGSSHNAGGSSSNESSSRKANRAPTLAKRLKSSNQSRTQRVAQDFFGMLAAHYDAKQPPKSASLEVVAQFNARFLGTSLPNLRQAGRQGPMLLQLAAIVLGPTPKQLLHSKSRSVIMYRKLGESAINHILAYMARLGISVWGPDYTQDPYSSFNMAMRMCALDTFRLLVAARRLDFAGPDEAVVNNVVLLTEIYDDYVHRRLYNLFKAEIATPGANERVVVNNALVVARRRLHESRTEFLQSIRAPARLKDMLSLKATSDDEREVSSDGNDDNKRRPIFARRRPERSAEADQFYRSLDAAIVQGFKHDGNTREVARRLRRVARPLGARSTTVLDELPNGMPIQYYDADWYTALDPHRRAKLEAKWVVSFVPNSTDFFSRRGEHRLTQAQLTTAYGDQVFAPYIIEDEDALEMEDGASDEEGESLGSHDSYASESVGSFISEQDGDFVTSDDDSGDDDENSGGESDEGRDWAEDFARNRADFATEYY